MNNICLKIFIFVCVPNLLLYLRISFWTFWTNNKIFFFYITQKYILENWHWPLSSIFHHISKYSLEMLLNLRSPMIPKLHLLLFATVKSFIVLDNHLRLLCRLLYTVIVLVDTLSLSSSKKTFAINAVSAGEC